MQVISLLRGDVGDRVILSVRRGFSAPFDVALTRSVQQVRGAAAASMSQSILTPEALLRQGPVFRTAVTKGS